MTVAAAWAAVPAVTAAFGWFVNRVVRAREAAGRANWAVTA
jgi:hypothetical protein